MTSIALYLSLHILLGAVAGIWFAIQRRSPTSASPAQKGMVFVAGLILCLSLASAIGVMQTNPNILDLHRYLGAVLVLSAALVAGYMGMKFKS